MTIRDQFQKLVGMPDFLRVMTTALNAMKREIIEACQDVLTAREPYLACVTFVGNTFTDDPKNPTQLRPTSFGAECFLYPGDEKNIVVPHPQRPVGHVCYFVSGHPNIVIKSMAIDNMIQNSSVASHKFGQIGKAIEVGANIVVTVSFRTASE